MNRIRAVVWLALVAGLSILALGFSQRVHWALALLPLALGMFWWLGARFDHHWLVAVVMLAYSLAAAGVFLGGFSPVWLALGLIAMLVAWDLQFFSWRLMTAGRVDGEAQIIARHLRRLAGVSGAGFLLSLAAIFLRFRLAFEVSLLLGALAILGLRQGIHLASRAEK
jgi:hypothetical protein